MNEYQEIREKIRKALRDDTDYSLQVVQKRPYTAALIYEEGVETPVGVGFAKVNHKDPWSANYGIRLATEKAIADAAKEALGDCSLLEVNGEHVAVYAHSALYEKVPDWVLDADLGTQPKRWKEAIPCESS